MRETLLHMMGYLERFRVMSVDSLMNLILFGGLAAFGILNVLLGYRLLRFWMMLGGFAIGAGLGYLITDLFELSDQTTMLAVIFGIGIVLGLIAFFVYRAGIFLMGAGIGITISIYVIHPNSSAAFFFCLLIGIVVGVLGVKFSRPVVIFVTSCLGGALAGIAIVKLANLSELPYALLIGIASAFLGMLIQFATNKPKLVEVYDEEEEEEEKENAKEEDVPYGTQYELFYDIDDEDEEDGYRGKRSQNKRNAYAGETEDSI